MDTSKFLFPFHSARAVDHNHFHHLPCGPSLTATDPLTSLTSSTFRLSLERRHIPQTMVLEVGCRCETTGAAVMMSEAQSIDSIVSTWTFPWNLPVHFQCIHGLCIHIPTPCKTLSIGNQVIVWLSSGLDVSSVIHAPACGVIGILTVATMRD